MRPDRELRKIHIMVAGVVYLFFTVFSITTMIVIVTHFDNKGHCGRIATNGFSTCSMSPYEWQDYV